MRPLEDQDVGGDVSEGGDELPSAAAISLSFSSRINVSILWIVIVILVLIVLGFFGCRASRVGDEKRGDCRNHDENSDPHLHSDPVSARR
jgi:hypothetical protein